jgi:NADPH:quinone reductase-like Zn-dependent oxidoreductase
MAGMNSIDSFVVSGALPKIDHLPRVPGAEPSDIVEVGSHANGNNFKKGVEQLCTTRYIMYLVLGHLLV